MKFFIDSADLEEIKKSYEKGWIDGVTTNPTLIAKTGRSLQEIIPEICKIVNGPISAEVLSTKAIDMIEEGVSLSKIHENIVVKIPLTEDGLLAVKQLSQKGIKTNVTLCFSPLQAILAAKAGATMISPFVGRLDDIGHNGLNLIADILSIYSNYGFKTEVLMASIRHPIHILEAAKMGVDIVTVPYKVLQQLVQHPLTDRGLEQFLKDAKK